MEMQRQQFADWFQQQLARRGWEQADFARHTGTSTANVSRWYGGVIPSSRYLPVIARAFGMRTEDVYAAIDGTPPPAAPRTFEAIVAELEANRPVEVPILQNVAVSAGLGSPVEDVIYLPGRFRRQRKPNIYGLIARGECMEPLIQSGDYVVFDEDATYEANDVVVAVCDGEVYVKRLQCEDGVLLLRADADGTRIPLDEGARILGRVIFITRPM